MPISAEHEKVKDEQPSLFCAGAGKNRDTSIDREETQCSRWVTSISSFFLNYGNNLFASAPFIAFPVSSTDVSSRFDEAQKEKESAQKERKIIIKMIDLRGEKSDLLIQKVLARLDKANDEELAKIQNEIQRVEEEITSLKRKIAETDKSHVS